MKWLVSSGIFVLVLFLSGTVAAQNSVISGTVTDQSTGEPLPGVNISVQGTTTGTTTNAQGQYKLQVPSLSDTLRFTFIGYAPATVPIQGRTTINVQLEPTTISGEELVVVGYGTQREEDLTGSVSVINVEEMTSLPETQVAEQLQGNASGLTVVSSGQPGDEPQIRIRGINTFGNNEPLYIVDGVPTQDINSLNSNNIASMQVLKDAAAASIYGSRASNGVIIITTKKGSGDITINYDAYYGYQVPPSGNVWNLLNSQEMANAMWQANRNSGILPGDSEWGHPQYGNGPDPVLPYYIDPPGASKGEVDESNYFIDPHYTDPSALSSFFYITRANKQGTNWFDELYDPAGQMSHNLSVSGGGDIGNYLFSVNYLDQQGTLMNQYLKRYTVRANTSFNVSDNIRIGENISYAISENPQFGTLDEGGPIGMSYREQPIIPVYDIGGNFAGTHAEGLGNPENPVAIAYRSRNNENQSRRLFGNLFAEIDFWGDRFNFRTTFGGEIYSGSSSSFTYPEYENKENSTFNQFNADSYDGYSYTWSNTLTYNQNFNDLHDVKVLLGTEAYRNKGQNLGGSTQSYFSFDPNFTNLSTGSGTKTNYSYEYEESLFSIFGRIDYSYDNRYIVSGTLRRDGSSKFLDNRYGWFPAASVGWRITEEEFFPDDSWITDLKIRAGYGIMGNQLNVAADNPYSLYAPSQTGTYYAIDGGDGGTQLGFAQSQIGNPGAVWEKNISTNIGLDATLYEGKVELTVDYYKKDIEDLLYNPALPATAGSADQPYVNVGSMKNTGVDASLSLFGNITKELQYNTRLTFTTYKNTIEKISNDANYFDQASNRFEGSSIVRNAVGHPVSSFYGYKVIGFWDTQQEIQEANANAPDGIYQNEVALGRFRYQDVNQDGQITPADRTFLGSPNPDFTYGLNIGFNYKSFDFSMFWYGSQGNELWNQVRWWTDFYGSFDGAKSKTMLYDSWTPENHNATAPILENSGSFSTNTVPNSYFVENGSYLRLKNVQLGYSIPKSVLGKSGIGSLRVYVQAANLLTITNYTGPDPEVGYNVDDDDGNANSGGTSTAFGIDEGVYPTARQFRIGISLSY